MLVEGVIASRLRCLLGIVGDLLGHLLGIVGIVSLLMVVAGLPRSSEASPFSGAE